MAAQPRRLHLFIVSATGRRQNVCPCFHCVRVCVYVCVCISHEKERERRAQEEEHEPRCGEKVEEEEKVVVVVVEVALVAEPNSLLQPRYARKSK